MTIAFVFAGLEASDDPTGARRVSGEILSASPSSRGTNAPLGDAQLATRIREGDHDAFTSVFLTHYDGLTRFAASYTGNTADAEELVEGVFTRVWEHHGTFAAPHGIGPYLYAAVRHRALNAVRDTRTRVAWEAAHARDLTTEEEQDRHAPVAPMIAALEREELSVILHRVIDTLPEHRRAVVTMRWFGGLSHAEIAAALGTSPNAVEIQLRRALKTLAANAPEYLREP